MIANQLAIVLALRKAINWRELGIFLIGGVIGLPIGIFIIFYVNRGTYTEGLGLLLIIYGAYMLLRPAPIVLKGPIIIDILAGFLGGITGGAIGFPGAVVTIWCSFKGWDKNRQRALFQPYILIMQLAALLTLTVLGKNSTNNGLNIRNILCIPGSILGTSI